jgi:hypothetical protein
MASTSGSSPITTTDVSIPAVAVVVVADGANVVVVVIVVDGAVVVGATVDVCAWVVVVSDAAESSDTPHAAARTAIRATRPIDRFIIRTFVSSYPGT